MKLVALTSAALLAATTAFAGSLNYQAPAEVPVVVEDTGAGVSRGGGSLGGSAGWVIPIVAIGLIALAVSSSHHDEEEE